MRPLNFTRGRVLDARIDAHDNAANRLASLDAELAPRIKWRDDLIAWRPGFVAELQACPPSADTREAQHRRLGLEITMRAIDHGYPFNTEMFPPDLPLFAQMRSAGYVAPPSEAWNLWRAGFGSLAAVTQRISELEAARTLTLTNIGSSQVLLATLVTAIIWWLSARAMVFDVCNIEQTPK